MASSIRTRTELGVRAPLLGSGATGGAAHSECEGCRFESFLPNQFRVVTRWSAGSRMPAQCRQQHRYRSDQIQIAFSGIAWMVRARGFGSRTSHVRLVLPEPSPKKSTRSRAILAKTLSHRDSRCDSGRRSNQPLIFCDEEDYGTLTLSMPYFWLVCACRPLSAAFCCAEIVAALAVPVDF
jgi:hypothetical protein